MISNIKYLKDLQYLAKEDLKTSENLFDLHSNSGCSIECFAGAFLISTALTVYFKNRFYINFLALRDFIV